MLSDRLLRSPTAGSDWPTAADRTSLTVWAPAKVNLFLEVLARRPDGYHEIATLMVAVNLYDRLDFRADDSGAVTLTTNHPDLSVGPDNLVVRAARLLRERTGHGGGAAIHLRKRIPIAAGLAGGSTDAAAALAGLNHLWGLGLSRAALADLAAELGSDVPFFFHTPAAWCTGRGEVVEPLALAQPLYFVLACPPVGCSTAEVYRRVAVPTAPVDGGAARAAAAAGDVEALGRLLFNRLQGPAEAVCPPVAELARRVGRLGAAGCLMSGSGSSVLAVCRDRREAVRTARRLRSETPAGEALRVFAVRSCV
jgi:4-diphosphocytidyl-2-C-methyl-D-erythritol kinase